MTNINFEIDSKIRSTLTIKYIHTSTVCITDNVCEYVDSNLFTNEFYWELKHLSYCIITKRNL